MELIDFKNNQRLNQLREKMGTQELGHFELFDPDRHASWQEKQQLAKSFYKADGHHLKERHNHLYFKNVRIIAQQENCIHFSYCDHLKKLSSKGQLTHIEISSQYKVLEAKTPCQYCLHNLDYQGFDVYRQRHQAHNEKILKEFDLKGYLKQYFANE